MTTTVNPSAQSGDQSGAGRSFRDVQATRARMGVIVVVAGDIAIALAAIWGVVKVTDASGSNGSSLVAILTSAFTAIGTMTTAYFGIKSMSSTAQSVSAPSTSPATTQPESEVEAGPRNGYTGA